METILEVIHTNADGSEVKATLDVLPIRHYIGIIKFRPADKLANAEFKNMEQYGWMGTVQPNYQAMENTLRSEITKNLGAGKAKCIIIFSHGATDKYNFFKGETELIFTSSHCYTSHSPRVTLSGLHFYFHNRLWKEIPDEKVKNKIEYETKKKVLDAELKSLKQQKQISSHLGNDRDYSIIKKEENAMTRVEYKINKLKENYNTEDEYLDVEIKFIKKHFENPQVHADRRSLGNIINMVEDGGSLIFASCSSGHGLGYSKNVNHPLLTEIINYYKPNINIFGIEKSAAFSSDENDKGLVDGNEQIETMGGMLLVRKSKGVNCAVKVTPSGDVSTFTDIKIVKSGFKLL